MLNCLAKQSPARVSEEKECQILVWLVGWQEDLAVGIIPSLFLKELYLPPILFLTMRFLNQLLAFMSTAETPSGVSWHFFFPILPSFLYLFIYKHVLLCKAYRACGDKGKLRSKLLGVLPRSIFSAFPVSLSMPSFTRPDGGQKWGTRERQNLAKLRRK